MKHFYCASTLAVVIAILNCFYCLSGGEVNLDSSEASTTGLSEQEQEERRSTPRSNDDVNKERENIHPVVERREDNTVNVTVSVVEEDHPLENSTDTLSTKIHTETDAQVESLDLGNINETWKDVEAQTNTDTSNKSSNTVARWNCSKLSLDNSTASIIVLKNETQLLELMSKSNSTNSCFLLYFYLQWCEFCAQMSVLINSISRIYHGFPVLAIDAYSLTSITGRFGITGVPSLLLFYNGRPIAKFNGTRSLQHLSDFIVDFTGMTAKDNLTTIAEDYNGPLVTKIEKTTDIYLLLSMLCLLVILVVNLCRTETAQNYLSSSILTFKAWALKQKRD